MTHRHNFVPHRARPQAGFTMIEVLVTFVILLVGLLGLIGLQVRSQQAELESYQRGQALILLQDMIDRMNANRIEAKNGTYTTSSPLGGGGLLVDCAGKTGAARDKCEWGNLLIGAAEVATGGTCDTTSSAKCVGAMLGARGCITYASSTEIQDTSGTVIPGSGIHTIAVAWQGIAPTVQPSNTCGQNLYPSEAQRRVVTATLRIAALKSI